MWHPRLGEGMPSLSPRSLHRFLLFFFLRVEEEAEEEPGFEASMASAIATSSCNLFSSRGVNVGVSIKAMNSALTLLRRTFHALRASFASSSLVPVLVLLRRQRLREEEGEGCSIHSLACRTRQRRHGELRQAVP